MADHFQGDLQIEGYASLYWTRDLNDDVTAAGAFVPMEGVGGSGLAVSSPIWLGDEEKVEPRPAPGLGEHTESVLRANGFTDREIADLLRDAVIARQSAS